MKSICVYCASSEAVGEVYFEAARGLGKEIAERGYRLVYGGGNCGLMGAVARTVQQHGGVVVGVIPQFMLPFGVSYEMSDELIVTEDMRERKATMERLSDAFIALPGGFGTFEELLEILTLKQLGRHCQPLAIINTNNYYSHLEMLFEKMYAEKFSKVEYRDYYHFAHAPAEALDYIENYKHSAIENKWFLCDSE